jgi:hypothetical protein
MNFCRNDIYFILIFIILAYLLYFHFTKQEGFDAITDMEAIHNLASIATKLQAGGLTVPGNLSANGSITISEKSGHPLFLDGKNNTWLINNYPDDNRLGIRGNKNGNWTDFNFVIDNDGNCGVRNQLNTNKLKIGSWTIQEINGHLQFIKDGTVYNDDYSKIQPDTGFIAMTQDGNLWINRKTVSGRVWGFLTNNFNNI